MKRIITTIIFSALFFSACEKYTDLTPKGEKIINTAEEYYDLVVFPTKNYPPFNFRTLVDDNWVKESSIVGKSPDLNSINFYYEESAPRADYIESSAFYNNVYSYINRWNMIITTVDYAKGDASLKARAKAEARLLRAFDYFMLVNVYAKGYNPATAATDGGVCLMREFDLEAHPTKASVKEVYDFIQGDIEAALPLLQAQPVNIYHPSLAFGYALKARVHLFRREYQQALAAAQKSLSYNNQLIDMVAYEANPTNITIDKNPEVLNLAYMNGYTEMNIWYIYPVSPEFCNLFDATNDMRFKLFFKKNHRYADVGSGAANWDMPATKFFYPTVGMKTGEMYLTMAECQARLGDLNGAMQTVNTLRSKRVKGSGAALATPATTEETVKLIIDERRRELAMGFNRFFDLKRLNTEPAYAKTLQRTFPLVNTTVPQRTYTLPPNSPMYIVPFPKDVMDKNPSLTQNY